MGFRVAILLLQLSPSGSGVHCPQSLCSGSGKYVLCYTGSWWSLGNHTSQESVFSVMSFRKAEVCIPGHSSFQLQAPLMNLCLVSQVPAWLHQLSPSTLSCHMGNRLHACFFTIPGCMVESPYFMAPSSWLPASLSTHPHSKCLARNFLCDLISHPSYDMLCLPIPLYLLPPSGFHL